MKWFARTYFLLFISHLDQSKRVDIALKIPTYLRPTGAIFVVVLPSPASGDIPIGTPWIPSIHIQIAHIRVRLARSALRSKKIKQLVLGVAALCGCAITIKIRLVARIQMRWNIYTCTWR